MASSTNEKETAAAAEQLRSISLSGSAERKDGNPFGGIALIATPAPAPAPTTNVPAAAPAAAPSAPCSACGKKSDTLKKCNGCKCVWYCDKDCQNKHRKEHKNYCRRIKKELDKRGEKLDLGTEKDVGPLGKLPPREDCPVCMCVLPIAESLQLNFPCCGKTLCRSCDYQHSIKNGRTADSGHTCAFCRTTLAFSAEEILARTRKRVELKDPVAIMSLAMDYGLGKYGLPVDQAKCIDLLRQSVDLGYSHAQCRLGTFHHMGGMGLQKNEEEGIKYWEKAAESGDLNARHNLGIEEHNKNRDFVAAVHHFRLSASGGYKPSMESLIEWFEYRLLRHCDLAETLRAFHIARSEMKSEDRDEYIKYLKSTGKYEADCDV